MQEGKEKLYRLTEHGMDPATISSPMEPPEAYDLTHSVSVPLESLSSPLLSLVQDHEAFLTQLNAFEKALMQFKESHFEMNSEISKTLAGFFKYMDEETPRHNMKEEKALFPILKPALIRSGECSPGDFPTTATDVMEEDHLKVIQSVALVFNFLGLSSKLKDADSKKLVLHYAVEHGRDVVETMRLHIFKENQILIPLAQKLLTQAEQIEVFERMKPYLR